MAQSAVDTELETLMRARYPIIYVVSWEEKRVEEALRAIAKARGKKMYQWTVTQGMVLNPLNRDEATRDPLAALDFVMESRDQAVFLLKDFHPFLNDTALVRRLRDLTVALKTSYKTIVLLSPLLKLPPELEKEITVVDYALPSEEDLGLLLDSIIQSVKANPQVQTELTTAEREQLLKAALGLTATEAENVFAKSLVERRRFDVDVILSEKEQIIRKSAILEYYRTSEAFGDVGGLDLLKDWMDKRTVAFTEKAREYGLPSPKGILILGVQGCGKCHAIDTPILMHDGSVKRVQNIKAGDLLMGPDSRPRTVQSIMEGRGEMYRVSPMKGEAYTVNADHILSLRVSGYTPKHKKFKDADANGLINLSVTDYLKRSPCFHQAAMGWRIGVDFPAQSVPLDPYFLGLWLGDGDSCLPNITTMDPEIAAYLEIIAAQYGVRVRSGVTKGRATHYCLSAGQLGGVPNPLTCLLRQLDVAGNKHIPHSYKANSREIRLQVLAGIIDTDGHQHGNTYDLIQKNETLAWDIVFLARSLGLAAYLTSCEKSCTYLGLKRSGHYFRVSISGDTDQIPVRIVHKKCAVRRQRKNVLNVGITVSPVGVGEYYGFELDGDGLFLLGDFTVTHNSLSAKAIASLWKLPLLRMDVGKIFGGIVGQSEENIRKAIRVAESTAPNIVWIDELEKGFSGTQSSGISDGGTTARVFGTFLAWLQDKTAPCFVVATANDVSALPPELLRKGRFDEIFFVDLPDEPEREEIFTIHLKKRKRDPAKFDLIALAKATPGYSGAEIEQAVISAMYDAFNLDRDIETEDILTVARQSVPLSLTMKEKIDVLRFWAETRARPASSAPPVETQEAGMQEQDDRIVPVVIE